MYFISVLACLLHHRPLLYPSNGWWIGGLWSVLLASIPWWRMSTSLSWSKVPNCIRHLLPDLHKDFCGLTIDSIDSFPCVSLLGRGVLSSCILAGFHPVPSYLLNGSGPYCEICTVLASHALFIVNCFMQSALFYHTRFRFSPHLNLRLNSD